MLVSYYYYFYIVWIAVYLIHSSQCLPFQSSSLLPNNNHNHDHNITSYFAICLAVKDELDIAEWIEYHRRKGCGKFYIFDNNSEKPLNNSIINYIKDGIVSYYYITGSFKPSNQIKIYNDCIKNFKNNHNFIGFIDADEFIVTVNKNNKYNNVKITEILKKYEDYGALALSWMSFGDSGHIKRPTGGVISNYYKCGQNPHIKSIVNTKFIVSTSETTHNFIYEPNYYARTTCSKKAIKSAWADKSCYNSIYINHYCTKSREDFEMKKKRKGGAGRQPTDEWFDKINKQMAIHNCSFLTMPPDI